MKIPNTTPRLGIFGTPTTFTILWAFVLWANEKNKKNVNQQTFYEDLKKEVVQKYKQSIDESKQQPLIDLLQARRSQLDPQLRNRLQVLEEWKRDNMWTFARDYFGTIWPSVFGMKYFPRSTVWIMCSFAMLVHGNYLNEVQLISGGKQKSYIVKNIIPKQDKLYEGYKYIFYGIMAVGLIKMGIHRIKRIENQRILDTWRKQYQKK